MNIEKHHAEEWKRQIINAGGDENVAQQAVALAALNGLFEIHRDTQFQVELEREACAQVALCIGEDAGTAIAAGIRARKLLTEV